MSEVFAVAKTSQPLFTRVGADFRRILSTANCVARPQGLLDRALGSGDRVEGSNPNHSYVFFSGLFYYSFFFPHHVNSLSQCLLALQFGFNDCIQGEAKRVNM